MRQARRIKPGAVYHIIGRINRREHALSEESIKELFLATMRGAKRKYQFSILNFTIMDNHVHLMLKPGENASLSRIMQWILGVFAVRFNKRMGYCGHVWQDRFKSKIIDDIRQFLHTFIYIATNAVRAGIVDNALDFKFNAVSFISKGRLDLLERPPNGLLKIIWPAVTNYHLDNETAL